MYHHSNYYYIFHPLFALYEYDYVHVALFTLTFYVLVNRPHLFKAENAAARMGLENCGQWVSKGMHAARQMLVNFVFQMNVFNVNLLQ